MIQRFFATLGVLVFSTFLLFAVCYLFFKTQNYYIYSLAINSFVLPTLYSFVLFKANHTLMKEGNYSLSKGFAFSFTALSITTLISHGPIFGFIHYLDSQTEQLLTSQWFDTLKTNATADNPKNLKQIIFELNQAEKNGVSILNFKNLAIFSFMQFFFNVFISFFISFFIRSRA